MDNVGKRIKKLRAEKSATQAQVATAIGITQTSVKDIEIGKSKSPAALTLIKLAKYFEVDSEWLLTGKGNKTPVTTYTQDEVELLLLFRALSPEGQAYVLGRSRNVYTDEHQQPPPAPTAPDASPPKPTTKH